MEDDAKALREWRKSEPVRKFASKYQDEFGGIHYFRNVPPTVLRTLVKHAPERLLENSSDNGPTLRAMLDLAEKYNGKLGGFITSDDRTDISLVCDTLVVPKGASWAELYELGPDELLRLSGGRFRLWWD